jgi:hypothetical protein
MSVPRFMCRTATAHGDDPLNLAQPVRNIPVPRTSAFAQHEEQDAGWLVRADGMAGLWPVA